MIIRRCAECVHRHCLTTQTQRLRLLCLTVACWALTTYAFHAAILDGVVSQAQQDSYIDEVHQRANERMRRRAEALEKELQLLASNRKEQVVHAEEERHGDSESNSTTGVNAQQPAVQGDQERSLPN